MPDVEIRGGYKRPGMDASEQLKPPQAAKKAQVKPAEEAKQRTYIAGDDYDMDNVMANFDYARKQRQSEHGVYHSSLEKKEAMCVCGAIERIYQCL